MQSMSHKRTKLSEKFHDFLRSLEGQGIPVWKHTATETEIFCEFFSETKERMCHIAIYTGIPEIIQTGFYIPGNTDESKEKDYPEGSEQTLVSEIANFIKKTTDIDIDTSAFEHGYNPSEWALKSIKSIIDKALQQLGKK
jgi:hypothetical protein